MYYLFVEKDERIKYTWWWKIVNAPELNFLRLVCIVFRKTLSILRRSFITEILWHIKAKTLPRTPTLILKYLLGWRSVHKEMNVMFKLMLDKICTASIRYKIWSLTITWSEFYYINCFSFMNMVYFGYMGSIVIIYS